MVCSLHCTLGTLRQYLFKLLLLLLLLTVCNVSLSSPSALVNKGNTLFVAQQFEKAREFYQEALR